MISPGSGGLSEIKSGLKNWLEHTPPNCSQSWLLWLRFHHEVKEHFQQAPGLTAKVGKSSDATMERSPKGMWEATDSLGMTSSLCSSSWKFWIVGRENGTCFNRLTTTDGGRCASTKYSREGRSYGVLSAAGVKQGRMNWGFVEMAGVAAASVRPLRDSLFRISSVHLQAAVESSRWCCQELKRHQLGSKNIANLLHHKHEKFISHDGTTFNTSAIYLNHGADRFKSGFQCTVISTTSLTGLWGACDTKWICQLAHEEMQLLLSDNFTDEKESRGTICSILPVLFPMWVCIFTEMFWDILGGYKSTLIRHHSWHQNGVNGVNWIPQAL